MMAQKNRVWLGLGANIRGAWGAPLQAIAHAVSELEACGSRVVVASPIFESQPMGLVRQPAYFNAVVGIETQQSPFQLLVLLKRLERQAGRRAGIRWGPRPLDIDILDYCGMRARCGEKVTRPGRLVLPHPGVLTRGFVVLPLLAVAPGWRHPVTGAAIRDVLRRNPSLRRGVVRVANLPGI